MLSPYTQVHFITPIDGKDSVMVNIEDDSPMYEVKIQLQASCWSDARTPTA